MIVVLIGDHSATPLVFSLQIQQMKCDSDLLVLFEDADGLNGVVARNPKSKDSVRFDELSGGMIPNEAQLLQKFDTLGSLILQPLQLELHDLPRLCPREVKASKCAGTAQLSVRESAR